MTVAYSAIVYFGALAAVIAGMSVCRNHYLAILDELCIDSSGQVQSRSALSKAIEWLIALVALTCIATAYTRSSRWPAILGALILSIAIWIQFFQMQAKPLRSAGLERSRISQLFALQAIWVVPLFASMAWFFWNRFGAV